MQYPMNGSYRKKKLDLEVSVQRRENKSEA